MALLHGFGWIWMDLDGWFQHFWLEMAGFFLGFCVSVQRWFSGNLQTRHNYHLFTWQLLVFCNFLPIAQFHTLLNKSIELENMCRSTGDWGCLVSRSEEWNFRWNMLDWCTSWRWTIRRPHSVNVTTIGPIPHPGAVAKPDWPLFMVLLPTLICLQDPTLSSLWGQWSYKNPCSLRLTYATPKEFIITIHQPSKFHPNHPVPLIFLYVSSISRCFPHCSPIFPPLVPCFHTFPTASPVFPLRISAWRTEALLEELEEQLGATSREATELKLQDLESDLRVTFEAIPWVVAPGLGFWIYSIVILW